MKIEFIDTDIGDKIIDDLKESGWRLVDEYPMVFDKGIDYDFYTLELGNKSKRNNMATQDCWLNNKQQTTLYLPF
jgi:hypothetical protein